MLFEQHVNLLIKTQMKSTFIRKLWFPCKRCSRTAGLVLSLIAVALDAWI